MTMTKEQISVTILIEKARRKARDSKYSDSYITPALDLLDKLDRRKLSYKELIYILADYYNCTNNIIYENPQYEFLSKNLELCEIANIERIETLKAKGSHTYKFSPNNAVEEMAYAGHSKLGEVTANLLDIKLSELTQVLNPNPPKFL